MSADDDCGPDQSSLLYVSSEKVQQSYCKRSEKYGIEENEKTRYESNPESCQVAFQLWIGQVNIPYSQRVETKTNHAQQRCDIVEECWKVGTSDWLVVGNVWKIAQNWSEKIC